MKFLIIYEDFNCLQTNELSEYRINNYLEGICNIYSYVDGKYYKCVIRSDGSIVHKDINHV